ncbi:hypothetical protein ACOSP7_023342 [Xanthoceras sorbifolium]
MLPVNTHQSVNKCLFVQFLYKECNSILFVILSTMRQKTSIHCIQTLIPIRFFCKMGYYVCEITANLWALEACTRPKSWTRLTLEDKTLGQLQIYMETCLLLLYG